MRGFGGGEMGGGGGGGGGGLFLPKLNVSEACAPLSHNQIWYRIVVTHCGMVRHFTHTGL